MNTFTIKDLENLSGIKAHTIRIWEQRYSFLKPSRTRTNIRMYSNDDLRILLNIAVLNKGGYKISHINQMSATEIVEKVAALNSGEAAQEKTLHQLIQRMVELDTTGFEKIIDRNIASAGMGKTITNILFPFFERIGILWQTSHINPAQEHLISNIIRQKLIVGIDKTKPALHPKKSFLLFLPENVHHEIGLLFVYYLLKRHGADVTYLGANVPIKDARMVADIKKPDYIYIHLTSASPGLNKEKFLHQLSAAFKNNKIILSGFITQLYKKTIPPQIRFIHSLSQLQVFISTL